ncbi:hypothetical protein [Desertivirga arenae]|uniref:hypothetical protein n=1 Tax=Desertivirga arenae TaxID=2810309 RepID=UPI001A962FE7|nr:hypothetical protein [Pedobacter sp. SYSU D00823]
MKTPVFYRFVLVCLVLALPLLSLASKKRELFYESGGEELVLADSTGKQPAKKPQDKKPEKSENERPDVIKEVPRSRKLPKPKAVIDRVRIKRPPVVRPGGIKKRMGLH